MKTLKYAVRFLLRSKSYTIINLLGLAFSLACTIILLRYIHRELTVDTHCIDREKVYTTIMDMEGSRGLSSLARKQKDSVLIDPQYIDRMASIVVLEKDYVAFAQNRFPARVVVADSTYFQLFHYPVLQGNLSLSKPQSVLLAEKFARKIFGNDNPIGKVLHYSNGKDVTVEGVLGEPRNKTSMQFDIVLSSAFSNQWERSPIEFYSFTSESAVEKLNQVGTVPRFVNPHATQYDTRQYTFTFVPVKDIYWDNVLMAFEPSVFSCGSRSHLTILTGVCILLLLTGILNFINIYMVAMLRRGKEYGLKKVFGANKKTLYAQIWVENTLIVLASLAIAWTIVEITATPVEHLFGVYFSYTVFDWKLSIAILVLLPILTSIYPFLKYNYAQPMASIRSIGLGNRSVRSRMAFLFIQYILTFLLVVLSLYSQDLLGTLLNTEPGFRTKDIIMANLVYEARDFDSYTEESINARKQRVRQIDEALSSCPDIEVFEASYEGILAPTWGTNYVNDRNESSYLNLRYVTPRFFQLYDIKFAEGNLSALTEDNNQGVFVVNRAALKALNYTTCEGAFTIEGNRKRANANVSLRPIVAVVEDYYGGHLTLGKTPTIFNVATKFSGDTYQIACVPGKKKEVLDFLRKLELKVYGSEDFQYSILEEDVKGIYDNDRQVASIYSIFAGIAIIISGLGLFGISLFDIRQRFREIAIRKVNGAQLKDLYPLLLRKYIAALGCAFVVAAPIAYFLINEYTKDFAVKAPISVAIFVIGLLIVASISLGTLLWQVRKAAHIDPAKIIKSE